MSDNECYTRTAKGIEELAAQPGRLTDGLKTLLRMIGEKTPATELSRRLRQVPEEKLAEALRRLVRRGYILAVSQDTAPEPDSDFTRYLARPVKEPTVHQRRHAEATLAGARRSKPGYHVSILNRPAYRIEPREGGRHCALIIDADQAAALALARNLMVDGFDVRSAVTRVEIVAELNRQPMPDVIVMDVDLPDTIGLELLGKLREHPNLTTVPVVVATANVTHDDVVAALAYGANAYVNKPIGTAAMADTVKGVLGL